MMDYFIELLLINILDIELLETLYIVGWWYEGPSLVRLIFDPVSITTGWPSSSVSWWRGGEMLDSSWEEISPGKSRNTMKLEKLQREDLNTRLECRGNNNNHTKPVITSIAINMNCKSCLVSSN